MFNDQNSWQRWLPTPGNIIFTVIAIAVTLVVQQIMAATTGMTQTSLISYQGYLTSNNDDAPLNGSRTLSFKLFDAPTNGNLIWGAETHQNIIVMNGIFDVRLGSVIGPISSSNEILYLETTVDGEVLSPRELFYHQMTLTQQLDQQLIVKRASFPISVSGSRPNYQFDLGRVSFDTPFPNQTLFVLAHLNAGGSYFGIPVVPPYFWDANSFIHNSRFYCDCDISTATFFYTAVGY